jgi:hypothetical protein
MRTLNETEQKAVVGGVAPGPNGETCTEPRLPPNGGLPGKWPQLPGTQDQIS